MNPMTLPVADLLLAVAVAVALAQRAFAHRVDLGPAVLACALSGLMGGAPSPGGALALGLAACVWGLARRSAAARGVGRPDLDGLVGAVAGVAYTASVWLPLYLPTIPEGAFERGGVVVTLLAGVLSVVLARERKGLAGQRVFHYREVPLSGGRGPSSASSAPAPGASPSSGAS